MAEITHTRTKAEIQAEMDHTILRLKDLHSYEQDCIQKLIDLKSELMEVSNG